MIGCGRWRVRDSENSIMISGFSALTSSSVMVLIETEVGGSRCWDSQVLSFKCVKLKNVQFEKPVSHPVLMSVGDIGYRNLDFKGEV